MSRKASHQVSFRVVVDPLAGAQTISVVEEEPQSHPFPVEAAAEPDAELQAALTAARERGRRRVAEILAEDGGNVCGNARRFACHGQHKTADGQVLGLDGGKRGFRFPSWQLDRDGRPYGILPKLHEVLGGAWAVYRFLVTPHGALGGRKALDALKRGQDGEVVAAAESVARGDFR